MRRYVFAITVLAIVQLTGEAQGQSTAPKFIPIKNGLWRITAVDKYIGSPSNILAGDITSELRRCVNDQGKDLTTFTGLDDTSDAWMYVDVQEKATEWVKSSGATELLAKITFMSPDKASVTGKVSYDRNHGHSSNFPPIVYEFHYELTFQGENCQGVRPGGRQIYKDKEWQY